MSTNTPIEKVKAFHSVKAFLSKEQQEELIRTLGLNEIDVNIRLRGKDNEIEFILLIYLLGWCKSIVGFDESSAKLTSTIATDLLIELRNGKKILVEIKSTEDWKFNLSQKQFKNKVDFAKSLGAELYFAVKFKGYWTLYSANYFESKNRKINIEIDFAFSEFNKIFGDRSFLFPKGLKIICKYSKSLRNHLGISNNDYGYLVNYTVEYNGENILEISNVEDEKYFLTFVFENLQDLMSNQSQDIIVESEDITTIIEEFIEEYSMSNLSHFILSPINHMIMDSGEKYDYQKYYLELIENGKILLTRELFLYGFTFLVENKYPILEKRDEYLYRFKDMIIKE